MTCIDYTLLASPCNCLMKLQDPAGNITVLNLTDAHYAVSPDGTAIQIVTPTKTVLTTTTNISVANIESAICTCIG